MPAKKRPRGWLPLDLDFFGRRRVQELAEEHGPGGPLVWLGLILEARKAALITTNPERQGELRMSYSMLAEMTFCSSPEDARSIVQTCIGLGLLEPLKLEQKRFHVRLAAWSKWEPDDVLAASRKQRSRDRKREHGEPEQANGDEPDDDYLGDF